MSVLFVCDQQTGEQMQCRIHSDLHRMSCDQPVCCQVLHFTHKKPDFPVILEATGGWALLLRPVNDSPDARAHLQRFERVVNGGSWCDSPGGGSGLGGGGARGSRRDLEAMVPNADLVSVPSGAMCFQALL